MRFVDVNLLVYAHRRESPDHDAHRRWLEDARRSDEPLGVSDLVLSGFLRVVTHPRIFNTPSHLDQALAFTEQLRAGANVVRVVPGSRHWDIFTRMVRRVGARGNDLPDVYLAAMAIEAGATLWSADRGFARFPNLRWRHPLDAA